MEHYDEDDVLEEADEVGSDELLSADNLRLPEDANPLVRLHAVRAWLARRRQETAREIGQAALDLQDLQHTSSTPLRRRELQAQQDRINQAQQAFQDAQQRLQTYEEAGELLEDCVTHTTVSERLLVEYYLTLEQCIEVDPLANSANTEDAIQSQNHSPRTQAITDVLHRIEQVGMSLDEA